MELLSLFSILRRRKGIVITSTVFFVVIAMTVSVLMPRSWQASTEVLVAGEESAASLLNDIGLPELATSLTRSSDDIQNKIYLATSRPVVTQAIWRLQLRDADGYLYDSDDVALAGILSVLMGTPTVEVSQVQGTDVLLIEATGPSSEVAALLADTLAEVYIEHTTQQARREIEQAQQFIQNQLRAVTLELDTAFAKIAVAQRDNKIIDVETEVRAAVGRLSDLLSDQQATLARIQEVRARIRTAQESRRYESATGISATTMTLNPVIGRLRTLLTDLRAKRQQLVMDNYTELAPEVKEVDYQIVAADAELKTAMEEMTALDPQVIELTAELAGLQQRATEVQAGISKTTDAFSSYPDKMREISQLELAASAAEAVYRSLQDQRFQIGIAGAMTMSDLRVVSPSVVPEKHANPKLFLNLALALLLGSMFGGSAAILLDYVDDTVVSSEDLRTAWYIPQLGNIPILRTRNRHLVSSLPPTDPLCESYRMLRNGLQFASPDTPTEVLLVTSSIPGEGKSTVAVNLAATMARDGLRVLLIDADMRAPTQHRQLKELVIAPGLSEVLSRTSEHRDPLQETQIKDLTVLTAGSPPPNPGQLVGSLRMQQAILEYRRDYDAIVIDAPPVLAVGDAIVLSRMVDGTLVVVESGRTTRRMLSDLSNRFEGAQIRPLGCVLNKVRTSVNPYGAYTKHYHKRAVKELASSSKQGGASS